MKPVREITINRRGAVLRAGSGPGDRRRLATVWMVAATLALLGLWRSAPTVPVAGKPDTRRTPWPSAVEGAAAVPRSDGRKPADDAGANGPGAALCAAHSPEERYRVAVFHLREWCKSDLAAAWRWALANDARMAQSGFPSLVETAVEAGMAVSAADTVAFVEAALPALADDGARGRLVQEAITALRHTGGTEEARVLLARWAAGPLADTLGGGGFELLAQVSADESPADAVAWLRTLPASHGRDLGMAAVAAAWANRDPAGAVLWSVGLEVAGARAEALDRTFSRWAELDAPAAAQWLAAQETEPGADRLIVQLLANALAIQSHPEAAVGWADLIRDDALYAGTLEEIVRAWGRRDAVAAVRYLDASRRLEPERRQQLVAVARSESGVGR